MAFLGVLSAAVNVSEGRRREVITAIGKAAARHVPVLDIHSDPDHNRSVFTLCGPRAHLVDAVLAMAGAAVAGIDLRDHEGAHPRLGAVDVVPFTPRFGTSMEEAKGAAQACARRLWEELAIPCFLYERSAATVERSALPAIRREAFRSMQPDLGGPSPHPTAGAAVVGAREPLVAFNVDLRSEDLAAARAIAAAMRRTPTVRALGLLLQNRGCAQVSMNLTDPRRVTVCDAYAAVAALAEASSVEVAGSELVGVVARDDIGSCEVEWLNLRARPKLLDELYRAATLEPGATERE